MTDVERLCKHCRQGKDTHGEWASVCLGYEPDTVCTSHFPMPVDPAPADYETWEHSWTFMGLDAGHRRHHKCFTCDTAMLDKEGDVVGISVPGKVAPPPRPKVITIDLGDRYAPNQLLVDAQEWVMRQPVQSAIVLLMIAPPPGEAGDPRCEVLWSEADLGDIAIMRQALDIRVAQQVAERVLTPYEDQESEDS